MIRWRFYYSILLGGQRPFNVSTGLDEASCRSRWSYSNLLGFLSSSFTTYRALRCLISTCFVLCIVEAYVGAHAEKTDSTAGGSGKSLAVAQGWSRFHFDGWIRVPVADPMQKFPTFSVFHLPILVNSSTVTRQRLPL